MISFLHFIDQGTRYSRDDMMSETWGIAQFHAKAQFSALLSRFIYCRWNEKIQIAKQAITILRDLISASHHQENRQKKGGDMADVSRTKKRFDVLWLNTKLWLYRGFRYGNALNTLFVMNSRRRASGFSTSMICDRYAEKSDFALNYDRSTFLILHILLFCSRSGRQNAISSIVT
jgi:hypothetical protein